MLRPSDSAHRRATRTATAPTQPPNLDRPPWRTSPAPPQKKSRRTKLFVLDTNVLMHDPTSLFRFEEHDIFLPMITLEELDGHKKGMTEVARNARQASRVLDALGSAARPRDIERRPAARPSTGHREAGGKLFFQTEADRRRACRPACRRARPTTRSSASCRPCSEQQPQRDGRAGVQGHQHAHQGARAGPAGRGLLQRQDARGHRPAVHRRAARCRPTSGTRHGKTMEIAGSRAATPSTASAARWCRRC